MITHVEPITFVGTETARARIDRLRARHGAVERIDGIRAEMVETDRVYAWAVAETDFIND